MPNTRFNQSAPIIADTNFNFFESCTKEIERQFYITDWIN